MKNKNVSLGYSAISQFMTVLIKEGCPNTEEFKISVVDKILCKIKKIDGGGSILDDAVGGVTEDIDEECVNNVCSNLLKTAVGTLANVVIDETDLEGVIHGIIRSFKHEGSLLRTVGTFSKVSYDEFSDRVQWVLTNMNYTKKSYAYKTTLCQELLKIEAGGVSKSIKEIYQGIELPVQKNFGSGRYSFKTPFDVVLEPGEDVIIPTGLHCLMLHDHILLCQPETGFLGANYRLDVTPTIVDSSKFFGGQEGHIVFKIKNNSKTNDFITLSAGDTFYTGVFLPYGVASGDASLLYGLSV